MSERKSSFDVARERGDGELKQFALSLRRVTESGALWAVKKQI